MSVVNGTENSRSFPSTSIATVENEYNNFELSDINSRSTNGINEHRRNSHVSDYMPDPFEEKKLLRKLDWYLVPPIALLYLVSFLDRVNIGQAKLNGLEESLYLTDSQYNTCVSVFFVTYVLFEIPSNLVLKILRPSRWLSTIAVAWGITTALTGLVRSYGALLACRLVLGACQSGIFPGGNFYLSHWYKRSELGWRISLFFSASAIAGAFGGILAYGIAKMDGVGKQEGWRWIFYLEGIVTVLAGIAGFFLIRNLPTDEEKFLTNKEFHLFLKRQELDASGQRGRPFNRKEILDALKMKSLYVWAFSYIGLLVPFYSIAYFSPTIIHNLGFASYKAQLLSAPLYAFAFLTTMLTAYISDKFCRRGIFIIGWLVIAILSFFILLVVKQSVIQYLAVILTAGSLSPAVAISVTFVACNVSPHTKRATAIAFVIAFGNIGGIISGQIYRKKDAPDFILGHIVNIGFCVLGIASVLISMKIFRDKNQQRADLINSSDDRSLSTTEFLDSAIGDEDPKFKFII